MRAAFYHRIARDSAFSGGSLDQQQGAIRAWMDTHSQIPIFIDEPAAQDTAHRPPSAVGSDRIGAMAPAAGRD